MKKVSLLAASVAIALTGCGGSDSGSGSNGNVAPGGVIVTGFTVTLTMPWCLLTPTITVHLMLTQTKF